MKVWISKYALTQGLYQIDGEPTENHAAFWVTSEGSKPSQYFRAGEWHETYEAAVARAEKMRVAKVRSYEKRLKELRAMKFEVPT